jgi:hypothetical protein
VNRLLDLRGDVDRAEDDWQQRNEHRREQAARTSRLTVSLPRQLSSLTRWPIE